MANFKKIYASKIYTSATAPANPSAGSFWYDSTNDLVKRYNGSTWVQIDITKYNVVYNDQTVTLATALNTIKTNIGTLGTELGELQTVVGDAESGLVKGVADNASAITALGGRMDTAEGGITALEGRMDTAEGYIEEFESGKVDKTTTVNGKALSGNITLGADDIDVSAAIGDIAAQGDSVEKVLGAVNTALGTKLTAASNLSDVADVATARTNLDVYSKSETATQISTAITNVTSTVIPAEGAVDTKLASEKAVADAVASVKTSLTSALEYKGTKDTYEELPAEGNSVGDVWNVVAAHGDFPAGTNYAWDGTSWDALGGSVDLSPYQTSAITVGEESTTVVAAITANKNAIDTHVANSENPHGVTKAQVGLGNVDNTSDADKPVSTAQQAALNLKQNSAISVEGITATTVEGALAELDSAIDGVVGSLDNYVEKSSISTAIPSSGAVDTKVASEKAVADGLATKADDSAVVHNTGNETIAGNKTFSGDITFDGSQVTFGTNVVQVDNHLETNTIKVSNEFEIKEGANIYFASGPGYIDGVDYNSLSTSGNKVPNSALVASELDKKANADASNVATNKAAWKTALGFVEAADVSIAVQTLTQNGTITLVAGKHYRFEGTTGVNEIEVNFAGSEIYFELMSGAEIVSVADTLVATVSETCKVITW